MMVRELLARLGVTLTPAIATPLYVGLVTDTGRFQYSNTDARAFRVAAELVELGVRPQEVFQHVFESVRASKLKLLARALGRIELRLGGRLAITWLTRADIEETGADEAATDGVIDSLRAIQGVEVAAFIRETADGPRHKVSMRSAGGVVDVSRIARESRRRRPHPGGGLLQRPRPGRADRPDRAGGTGRRCLTRPACCCSTRRPAARRFGAIAALRPVLGRKLGHAGTLDPFATGLLIVLAGRATRLAAFLTGLDKRYRAVVRFGVTSTTDDPEGDLTATDATTDETTVLRSLGRFRGPIRQVPPAASAVHVDGVRAYKRFRRGEEVAMPERAVTVHAIDLVAFDPVSQTADLDVRCSTGTYIRALARDLGDAVGAGGYCSELRRTEVGPFSVDDAVAGDGDIAAALRPAADAVPHLPRRQVTPAEAEAIGHGRRIAAHDEPAGPVVLLAGERLVAIGTRDGDTLRPGPVF